MKSPRTVRERAAAALDAEADASPSEVRSTFLKRLAAEDFSPPEEAVWAANALADANLPLSEGAKSEAAIAESEVVDRFAQEYWSLPPETRFTRWKQLSAQATDDETKRRLAELEAGLPFEVVPHENALVEIVASAIRELYVLKPREFIVRRTGWLIENREQWSDLRDASKRLRSENHAFNRLVPSLAVELARNPPLEAVPAIDQIFAEAEREEIMRQDQVAAEAQVYRAQSAAEPAASSGCGGWSIYLVIGLALFGLRACGALMKTSSDTKPTWRYEPPPPLKFNTPPKVPSNYTQEQLRAFRDYERRRAAGEQGLVEPDGYMFFRLSGGTFREK